MDLLRALVAELRCRVCDSIAARVEVVAPGQPPAEWETWEPLRQRTVLKFRDSNEWYLLFEGVEAGNGWVGDPIDVERALLLPPGGADVIWSRLSSYCHSRRAGSHFTYPPSSHSSRKSKSDPKGRQCRSRSPRAVRAGGV